MFENGIRKSGDWVAVLFAALILSACSEGGTTPEGSFTVSLGASAIELVPGGTGSLGVTVARASGFEGAVTIAAEQLPTGVTAAPITIAASATTGTLTLSAAPTAAGGTSNVTVRGTAAGIDPHTVTFTLTVAEPDFLLEIATPEVLIEGGMSQPVEIVLTRMGGFAGQVALTAAGLPAGVTSSFAPSTVPAGSTTSILTLTAAANVIASSATVTIQGAAQGVGQRSATLALELTPAVSEDIELEFCPGSATPIWLAVQTESTPMTRVSPTGSTFRFKVPTARGAIAYVLQEQPNRTSLHTFYGTRGELRALAEPACLQGNKSVTAVVVGQLPSETLTASLGGAYSDSIAPAEGSTIPFNRVPTGSVDLLAATLRSQPTGIQPSRFLVRRAFTPLNGSILATINLGGAEAFAAAVNPLTVTGLTAGQNIQGYAAIRTANGLLEDLPAQTQNLLNWFSFPADKIAQGDRFRVTVVSTRVSAPFHRRIAARVATQPGSVTLALGPALNAPTVTSTVGNGHARPRVTFTIQPEYSDSWSAVFIQGTGAVQRSVSITTTRRFRGGATGIVPLEVPSFAGVAGFQSAWGLAPGEFTTYALEAYNWRVAGGVLRPPWTENVDFKAATFVGQFTAASN